VSWFREALRVHAAYVHPPVPHGLVRSFVSRESLDDFYRDEGEKLIAPACSILEQAKVSCTKHLYVGPVAESIVKLAGDHACELIWMGTHGQGATAAFAIGSVARKVLQLAPVPVLLVR
jgi:nucleotide-binding universal stress UspA family protein